MSRRPLVLCLFAMLPVLATALPLSAGGEDSGKVVTVRCGKGKTIADVLGEHHGPLIIQIVGTCQENVIVQRNDVTLAAGAPGAAIQATDPTVDTLTITADRFVLDGLSVTGGRNGITVAGGQAQLRKCTTRGAGSGIVGGIGILFSQGASGSVDQCDSSGNPADGIFLDGAVVTITNSKFTGNKRNGVFVFGGSTARIGLSSVFAPGPNTISDNAANGIHVSLNSMVLIHGNTVTGNGTNAGSPLGRFGILLFHSRADLPGGNTISANFGPGIVVTGSSAVIGDPGFGLPSVNVISGNSTAGAAQGIAIALGSAVVLRNATVDKNNGTGVAVSGRSTLSVFSGTLTNHSGNGLQVSQGSAVLFQVPPASISPNTPFDLKCLDGESSFSGQPGGTPNIDCTGF